MVACVSIASSLSVGIGGAGLRGLARTIWMGHGRWWPVAGDVCNSLDPDAALRADRGPIGPLRIAVCNDFRKDAILKLVLGWSCDALGKRLAFQNGMHFGLGIDRLQNCT